MPTPLPGEDPPRGTHPRGRKAAKTNPRTCGWLLGFALLASCGEESPPGPLPDDATLPSVAERTSFEPEILAAFDEAEAMVRSSPIPANWATFGRVFHAHEQLVPAIDSYRAAIDAGDATNRTAHLLALALDEIGERESAIESMRRAATLEPANPTSTWRLGQWLLEDGDEVRAEVAFRNAVTSAPDDFGCLLAYGKYQLDIGRPEEAIQPLAKAARAAPNLTFPRFLLGTALKQSGREEEARPHLERGRRSTPFWPDQHAQDLAGLVRGPQAELRRLARLSDQGDPSAALGPMRLLGERLDHDANYHVQLAKVHRRLDRLPEAEACILTALERRPRFADALYQHAGLKQQQWLASPKDDPTQALLEEALEIAAEVIVLRPSDPNPHALRAQVLANLGRFDESSAAWMSAHELDDGSQKFEFRSAKVYLDARLWNEAADRLETMVQRHPRDLQLRRLFGLTLAKAGRVELARGILLSVAERIPNDPEVAAALEQLP